MLAAYPQPRRAGSTARSPGEGGPARPEVGARGSASTTRRGRSRPDPDVEPILDEYRTGDRVPADEEITERMFLAMLVEATRTLEEGIVRDPADVDMVLILGIGFPPFRGESSAGPTRSARRPSSRSSANIPTSASVSSRRRA